MTAEIALILGVDGIATGAIYVLVALGIVLIFSVTRVVFVPFGDLAAFTALTLAALQSGQLPGTVWLVAVVAGLTLLAEAARLVRSGRARKIPSFAAVYFVLPMIPVLLCIALAQTDMPMAIEVILAVLLVLPLGPLLNRLAFRPIADAPVLVLLIVAVALHFALAGLGLIFFGPEGFRTEPLSDAIYEIGGTVVSAQAMLVVLASVVFMGLLYLFFEFTHTGKALRATAVNRVGARLMGIRPTVTGDVAFLLASLLAGVAGVLIGPITSIYYDSGFLFGLKAFVGAIIGGLVSYPITALGALFVGLLESYASFWNSAFKEVVIFSFLIPVLLWRSISAASHEEEEEEE
ncbi:branched-chain amino acid ABC transporter permease (plasmid) [Neorhizobium sp. SOG26]|uniref:Branched-chain amino acid ABC transporter permease n=1 Tax=Neorhizobium turbinariae TaxID=2937795 RepID=A0ABT0INU3_9HYPH|nr:MULTISPECIES: branched-chain amino acid ABC transporter permease [Neorhizobium]AXV18167.1 branched-chain amino acid ABC transporter permease [Neorhizobium sp. SOG26]MCK8779525.1 branched-chain amino acid ABC transporter permease [Neorhizobium turbinariae]